METQNLERDYQIARQKSAKPMLWISMVSMTMMFIGLTSAYIVSSNREDWVSFNLPSALYISTVLIIASSIAFILAKRSIKKDDRNSTTVFLLLSFVLGLGFAYFQIQGFYELNDAGIFLSGKGSLVSASMLMVISFAHLVHVFAGFIVLLVVIYNHFKKKYNATKTLGLELGGIFWHFVDVLWVFLFLFFYFIT